MSCSERARRSTLGRTLRGWLCACAGLVAGTACAFLPVEGGLDDCSGALLASADDSGATSGAECLARMRQEGGSVAEWLEREGNPDYFEVSAKRIRLLYIEQDQVVELSRSASGAISASTSTPIRASDHMRFRNEDRARLGQARINRVPAPPAAEEERPNEVRRARVGDRPERPDNVPPPASEGTEP